MIGGRTRKAKNLHFAAKPKRRLPLKLLAAVLVVLVLVIGAGLIKAAVATEPSLSAARTLPSSKVLAGTAPKPAWPAAGQAAVEVEGLPPLGSSGPSTPIPIASLAKIMTAYVILHDHPVEAGGSGFTITVTAADVTDFRQRQAANESVVAVSEGEQLTELQLLQGLLVPSGNNFAVLLADHDAGSVTAFVAKMQADARALGMTHTTYTDPSGLLSSTVSTASDQLLLAARAMANPVFASIVAMTSVDLPVAGQLPNFNKAVGHDGYVGIKTGSDSTAGGCLVFANRQSTGGHAFTILGVVLGQDRGQLGTAALIAAALGAADALVHSIAPAVTMQTVVTAGSVVAVVTNAQNRRVAAAATAPLTVMGFGGMTIPLSVSLQPLGKTLHAGDTVAQVSIPGGRSVPAKAASTMPPVSFSWKLLHDY